MPIGKRRRLARWLWLPVFLGLLGFTWKLAEKPPVEPWPVICLHEDGKVTLGNFEGRELADADLKAWREQLLTSREPVQLILRPAPGLPLAAWYDTLCKTGGAGISHYQLQSGPRNLSFHFPGSAPPSDSRSPQIIDLLDGAAEEGGPEDIWDPRRPLGSDVHVIFKRSMSFEELYDAIAPHVRPGVSMVIANPRFYFMRTRDEDQQHLPPPQPSLWERLKEKITAWVK